MTKNACIREFRAHATRVQHDAPVVVLTTSETTTSGVLAVLSDTTVTGRDVAAVLAGLREAGRHFLNNAKRAVSVLSC